MCGISTIVGYGVQSDEFNSMMADLHERTGSRGKAGCGFDVQSSRGSFHILTDHPASSKIVESNLWQLERSEVRERYEEIFATSHARWVTSAKRDTSGIIGTEAGQPMTRVKSQFASTIAFNGNCPNHTELSRKFLRSGEIEPTQVDTITLHSLLRDRLYKANSTNPTGSLTEKVSEAVGFIMQKAQGAHSIIWHVTDLARKEVAHYAFRGTNGNRPLSIGSNGDNIFSIASESALFPSGIQFVDNVRAGELIEVRNGQMHRQRVSSGIEYLCSLELLYLLDRESKLQTLDGLKSVHEIHINMGKQLWSAFKEKFPDVKPNYIIGAPNGGMDFAAGMRCAAGMDMQEGDTRLVRNHNKRSYISETRAECVAIILEKFHLQTTADLRGKKIVVVDDTIVKGDTMVHGIVPLLRSYGADVFIAIPSPPLRNRDDRGAVVDESKLISRDRNGGHLTDDEIFTKILGNRQGVFMSKSDMIASSQMGRLHTKMF